MRKIGRSPGRRKERWKKSYEQEAVFFLLLAAFFTYFWSPIFIAGSLLFSWLSYRTAQRGWPLKWGIPPHLEHRTTQKDRDWWEKRKSEIRQKHGGELPRYSNEEKQ